MGRNRWLRRLNACGVSMATPFIIVSEFNFVEGFAVLWLRRFKVSKFDGLTPVSVAAPFLSSRFNSSMFKGSRIR